MKIEKLCWCAIWLDFTSVHIRLDVHQFNLNCLSVYSFYINFLFITYSFLLLLSILKFYFIVHLRSISFSFFLWVTGAIWLDAKVKEYSGIIRLVRLSICLSVYCADYQDHLSNVKGPKSHYGKLLCTTELIILINMFKIWLPKRGRQRWKYCVSDIRKPQIEKINYHFCSDLCR